MNEYLASNRWDAPDFVDPGLVDTRLTPLGEAQASALRPIVRALDPPPEVLVASPLTRALRTAELAFEGSDFRCPEDDRAPIRRVTCALARERVFHASDVGRRASAIEKDFPGWCLREIRERHGEGPWWYVGGGEEEGEESGRGDENETAGTAGGSHPAARPGDGGDAGGDGGDDSGRARGRRPRDIPGDAVTLEPALAFEARMARLVEWIDAREESVLALVAHWGVWYSLTGREFENCELVAFDLEDLEPGKGEMPV
jgi:hypothetical protein